MNAYTFPTQEIYVFLLETAYPVEVEIWITMSLFICLESLLIVLFPIFQSIHKTFHGVLSESNIKVYSICLCVVPWRMDFRFWEICHFKILFMGFGKMCFVFVFWLISNWNAVIHMQWSKPTTYKNFILKTLVLQKHLKSDKALTAFILQLHNSWNFSCGWLYPTNFLDAISSLGLTQECSKRKW